MTDSKEVKEAKNDSNNAAKDENKPASKKGKKRIVFLLVLIGILIISLIITLIIDNYDSKEESSTTDKTSQESTSEKNSTTTQSPSTQSNTSDKRQASDSSSQSVSIEEMTSETPSSPKKVPSNEQFSPVEEEKQLSAKASSVSNVSNSKPDSLTPKPILQQMEIKEAKKIAWVRFSDHLFKLEEQRGETFKTLLKSFPPQHFASQPPLDQRLEFHALSNVKIKSIPAKRSFDSQPTSVLDWQTLIKNLILLEKEKENLIEEITGEFPQSFPKKALVNPAQAASQDQNNSTFSPIAPLSSPTVIPSAQSSEPPLTQPPSAMSAQSPLVTALSSSSPSSTTPQASRASRENWAKVVQQLIAIEENRQQLSLALEKMDL